MPLLSVNQNGHALRGFIDFDDDFGGTSIFAYDFGGTRIFGDDFGGISVGIRGRADENPRAHERNAKTTHDGPDPYPDTSTN